MSVQYKAILNDKQIITDITETLRASLTKWYGIQAVFSNIPPEVLVYKSSFFLRFPVYITGNRKNILVKIRRRSTMQTLTQAISEATLHTNTQTEYFSLVKVFDFFSNIQENLSAVRPLIYLDRWHAFAMEEFRGVSLHYLIMRCQKLLVRKESVDALLDAARKTGRWLYLFHHQLHICTYQAPEVQIIGDVRHYAKLLEKASHEKISSQVIEDLFKEKLSLIKTLKLPVSYTHGDLSCNNILYSTDKQICAIDIQGKIASIYSDLCLIMVHPETFKVQVFTFGLFFQEHILRDYRRAILDGYFGDNIEDCLFLNIYCALMILDKWVRYEDNATRYRGVKQFIAKLISPVPKFYFKSRIKRYLDSKTPADCGIVKG
jgi:hypothetical protein